MDEVIRRFQSHGDEVVLEGFHAIKHAWRFGAQLTVVACAQDPSPLVAELAPDVAAAFASAIRVASLDALSPRSIPTGVIALAKRAEVPAPLHDGARPLVLLEEPRHLGNLGACVRVAAAADVDGLVVTGTVDPWHPECVRGAAGLQFALPVARVEFPFETARPLLAFDPSGAPLHEFPDDAIVAFGTERAGLSDELKARADRVVGLPMRAGVSSLNLATSVAAALYWWRLRNG